MTRTSRRGLGLLATLLVACAAEVGTDGVEAPIHAPDALDQNAHPQVTILEWRNTSHLTAGNCSGSLIASNAVLTAAHCFDDLDRSPGSAAELWVYIGHNASSAVRTDLTRVPGIDPRSTRTNMGPPIPSVTAQPQNVVLHPSYVIDSDQAVWDVAVVILDTPIPEPLVPALPVLSAAVLPTPPAIPAAVGLDRWVGATLVAAGAGRTNAACTSGAWSDVALLDVPVFDVLATTEGPLFQLYGSGEAGHASHTCPGDSGGPVVTRPGAVVGTNLPEWHVAALSSGVNAQGAWAPILQRPAIRNWLVATALDADGDGLEPPVDNCDDLSNLNQADVDGDGWGDPCDLDDDEDGVFDEDDNCPLDWNPDQMDWDGDGAGEACDNDEFDVDNDFVLNAQDNCPYHPNPGQENCNELAERLGHAGTDGRPLGDACDPAPCARPRAVRRTFVVASSGPGGDGRAWICFNRYGRSIEDVLELRPQIASDVPAYASASVEARFCPCEAATAEDCALPPWGCALDPAAGSSWLPISLTEALDPTVPVAQPLAALYTPWVQWPQPVDTYGWDFRADHDQWVVQDGLWTPTPSAPRYGPGTDMEGLLWVSDPTSLGVDAHGGSCSGPGCSLASSYLFPVRPDRAATLASCRRIPETQPPWWWTYCPVCGDVLRLPYEDLVNPPHLALIEGRMLLFTGAAARVRGWPEGAGIDVSDAFDPALLRALGDGGVRWAGASEPLAALREGQPRAFAVAADGTALVGAVEAGPEGFGLRELGAETPLSRRDGFAATYSLARGEVFLAGGAGARGASRELWTLAVGTGEWTQRRFEDTVALDAEAATFSGRDDRLWIVDRDDVGRRVLRTLRVDGGGAVETHGLETLWAADGAWLRTLGTGEVLLVTRHGDGYELTFLLGDGDGGLRILGSHRGEGRLVTPPRVEGGVVGLGVERRVPEGVTVEARSVPVMELLAR